MRNVVGCTMVYIVYNLEHDWTDWFQLEAILTSAHQLAISFLNIKIIRKQYDKTLEQWVASNFGDCVDKTIARVALKSSWHHPAPDPSCFQSPDCSRDVWPSSHRSDENMKKLLVGLEKNIVIFITWKLEHENFIFTVPIYEYTELKLEQTKL